MPSFANQAASDAYKLHEVPRLLRLLGTRPRTAGDQALEGVPGRQRLAPAPAGSQRRAPPRRRAGDRNCALASCFARIASAERSRGRRLRRHDTWIAATAMRHGAAVLTQDSDFSAFAEVAVLRV
ncbi:MAG: PIN domain-containing protein [Chloroflexota bacterium]